MAGVMVIEYHSANRSGTSAGGRRGHLLWVTPVNTLSLSVCAFLLSKRSGSTTLPLFARRPQVTDMTNGAQVTAADWGIVRGERGGGGGLWGWRCLCFWVSHSFYNDAPSCQRAMLFVYTTGDITRGRRRRGRRGRRKRRRKRRLLWNDY